jgi:ZIP family zinc transporter
LLLGALVVFWRPVAERTLGLIMAFGAGVLIAAVTFELVLDSAEKSGGWGVAVGMLLGALAFYFGDLLIDRAGGKNRKAVKGMGEEDNPTAIVLGAVLDGVPESLVLGLSLLQGQGLSMTLLVAIFLSNIPEGMAASAGLEQQGRSRSAIVRMWLLVITVSALAAGLGFLLLDAASPLAVAVVQSFAGGAIIAMLADTMMPEAHEHGGDKVALATTLGFVVSFLLAWAE